MPKAIDVTFPLSIEAARDIIGDASAFWADHYGAQWDREACRYKLKTRTGGPGYEVVAKVLTVDHAAIARGLSRALAGKANKHQGDNCRRVGARIIESITFDAKGCSADGLAKDAILQIAVFGAVEYG